MLFTLPCAESGTEVRSSLVVGIPADGFSRHNCGCASLIIEMWRGGRVAEGNGLLNRRRDKISTEGSNPSLSATTYSWRSRIEMPGARRYRSQFAPLLGSMETS